MTLFEYLMVLLSVVLSLALAQLATGFGELVRAASRVRWSAAYGLWMLLGLGLVIDLWTSLWLVRGVERWGLVTLVFMLLQCLTIYLYVLWLLPREIGEREIDLWRHLLETRGLFLAALACNLIAGAAMNLLILPPGEMGDLANFAIIPIALLLTGLAWRLENRWLQRIVPLILVALMLLNFAVHFPTIG